MILNIEEILTDTKTFDCSNSGNSLKVCIPALEFLMRFGYLSGDIQNGPALMVAKK
jgi:hypothetical protein